MYRQTIALMACVAAISASPTMASTGTTVPKTDWSYSALTDLSQKGLVEGYPKSADLFGTRELNRYEMAALVSRVVARLVDDESVAKTADPTTIDEISKLLKDYSSELAVLGTDVADLKLGLQSVMDTMQDHQKSLDTLDKSKVGVKAGSVTFSGLLQVWFLDGNKDVTNFGGGSGTGLGLTTSSGTTSSDSALSNTFKIRRSELKFSGVVDKQAYWFAMFDPSKNQNLTTKAATDVQATNGTSALQDIVVGWHLNPTVDAEVGQQKVPLSIEGYRSSANLLTIERSLINTVSYGQGRMGDIRDLGFWLRYNNPNVTSATFAVLDDAGNRQNLVDDNNGKEIFGNYQFFPIKGLQLGGYGEITGNTGYPATPRRHGGLDFDYVKGADEFTGETAASYDGKLKAAANTAAASLSPTTRLFTQGSYVTYAHKFNPTVQGVLRYDTFNPNRDMNNNEKDITVGVNYYMNGNNSKIQVNYITRGVTGPLTAGAASAYSSLGTSRYVWMTNFQQSL